MNATEFYLFVSSSVGLFFSRFRSRTRFVMEIESRIAPHACATARVCVCVRRACLMANGTWLRARTKINDQLRQQLQWQQCQNELRSNEESARGTHKVNSDRLFGDVFVVFLPTNRARKTITQQVDADGVGGWMHVLWNARLLNDFRLENTRLFLPFITPGWIKIATENKQTHTNARARTQTNA